MSNKKPEFDIYTTEEFHKNIALWQATVLQLASKKKTRGLHIPIISQPSKYSREFAEDALDRIEQEINSAYGHKVIPISLRTLREVWEDDRLLLNIRNEDGTYSVNNKLQRLEAWSEKDQSEAILSFITGMYVPCPVLVYRKKNINICENHMIPADGQQRIISLNKFTRGRLRITGTGTDLDGYTFDDLDRVVKNAILDIVVDVDVLNEAFDNDAMIKLVFHNLNTKGKVLTPTEKAQATAEDSEFMDTVEEMIGENNSLHKLLYPNQAKATTKPCRKKELAAVIHTLAMTNEALDPKASGYVQNTWVKKQNQYMMQNPTKRNGDVQLVSRAADLMLNTFGEKFACHFAYKGKKKTVVFYNKENFAKADPFYCEPLDTWYAQRSENLGNRRFLSVFYTSLMLHKAITDNHKKAVEMTGYASAIARGTAEQVILSKRYSDLMSGGSSDLERSRLMFATVAKALLDSTEPLTTDAASDAIIRDRLNKEYKKMPTEVKNFNWRTV